MTLAEKILFLRKREGMSQEELAEQLDLSRQAIYKWECGESIPSLDKLKSIAALFQVSFDYLIDDSVENVESKDPARPAPKERPVYFTGNVLDFNQIDADNGYGENSGNVTFEEALDPSIKNNRAKDVLAEFGITDLFQVQEMSDTHFFYDPSREVCGLFYAGMIQFVCPIENVLGFAYGGGERTLHRGSAPVMGFGVGGGGASVMVGRASTLSEGAESEVWATLTYRDGSEIKELLLDFDVMCSTFLGKIHDYDFDSMTKECTGSLLKNLARLAAKLSALHEKAQSILLGNVKAPDVATDEFALRNQTLEADYKERIARLNAIAAAANKQSRIKTAIAVGALAAVAIVAVLIIIAVF